MALCDNLAKLEKNWNGEQYYAKIIPVIQSSGTGKSRLLSEFGKTTLSVYYTIRESDETGYPPGDESIRTLFFEVFEQTEVVTKQTERVAKQIKRKSEALAISFLAATFQQCK